MSYAQKSGDTVGWLLAAYCKRPTHSSLGGVHSLVAMKDLLYLLELIVLLRVPLDVILCWDCLTRQKAVIDSAHAEFEYTSPCEAYNDNTTTAKLVSEDTTIPP